MNLKTKCEKWYEAKWEKVRLRFTDWEEYEYRCKMMPCYSCEGLDKECINYKQKNRFKNYRGNI